MSTYEGRRNCGRGDGVGLNVGLAGVALGVGAWYQMSLTVTAYAD